MKNVRKYILPLLVIVTGSMAFMVGCKSDEPNPDLTLVSLMAGGVDLNGASAATGIATDADIVAVFSTTVDATTATSANVVLTNTTDNEVITTTVKVSGDTVTVSHDKLLREGASFSIELTAGLASDKGKALTASVSRNFTASGILVPNGQMLYVKFDGSIMDETGNNSKSFDQNITFGKDRFGNDGMAATFAGATAAGNGSLIEISGDKLINSSMSLSLWFYVNTDDYVAPGNKPMFGMAANNGYFFEVGDGDNAINWIKPATDHMVSPDPKGHGYATSWGDFGTTDSDVAVSTLMTTGWHHFMMTFDADTYTKTDYLDGQKVKTFVLLDETNNEWNLKDMALNPADGVDGVLALGYFCSRANTNPDWANFSAATNTFKGMMDDFRLFDSALSEAQVSTLYSQEKP